MTTEYNCLPEIAIIKKFSKIKLYQNKTIVELLKYDNSSLWWLVEPWLNNKVNSVPTLYDYVYGKNDSNNSIKSKILRHLMNYSFKVKLNIRKNLIGKNKFKNSEVLITSHTCFLQQKCNVRVGNIINEFEKKKSVAVIYYDDLASFGVKTKQQRILHTNVNPIEAFFDDKTKEIVIKNHKLFMRLWKDIQKDKKFISKILSISKYNLPYNLIFQRLDIIFNKMIYEAIFYLECTKRAIGIIKPKLVLETGGPTLQCRAIVMASKNLGIPVISIQEGIIYDTRYYVHSKDEVVNGYPVPDKFAVYGEFTRKKLLGYGCYEEDNIELVGQANTDNYFNYSQNIINEKLKKLFPKIKNEKIILYATIADLPEEVAFNVLSEVLKLIKTKEYFLLIKPHPRDRYIKKYKQMTKNMKNVIVSHSYNIYDAILISNLIIAFSVCTVVLESIIFDKPIIAINPNLEHFKRFQDYNSYGVVVLVKDLNDLPKSFDDIMTNTNLQNRLKYNRSKFIKHHIFKFDGKVSKRIYNIGLKLIERKDN